MASFELEGSQKCTKYDLKPQVNLKTLQKQNGYMDETVSTVC